MGPRRSSSKIILGILLCGSVVGAPLGIALLISGLRKRVPNRAAYEAEVAFIENAKAVMAFPLMVNSQLQSPGQRPAPGLVLVAFDPKADSLQFMSEMAVTAGDPVGRNLPPRDEAALIELMVDEEYQRSRRRLLPPAVTRGVPVYACDLSIHPLYLPDQHLCDEMPMIPCLAEPGDAGQIRHVPYWCAFEAPPPAWARFAPVMTA